jgi:hypothetical protein
VSSKIKPKIYVKIKTKINIGMSLLNLLSQKIIMEKTRSLKLSKIIPVIKYPLITKKISTPINPPEMNENPLW